MAIKAGNKLTKLRSALKKMNSFGKQRQQQQQQQQQQQREDVTVTNSSQIIMQQQQQKQPTMTLSSSTEECCDDVMNGLHTVYVGKSLRPYNVSQQVLDHPVIKELVLDEDGFDDEITVIGCEVVLFEHLLWMLHNSDAHSEPLDDLVHFYAY